MNGVEQKENEPKKDELKENQPKKINRRIIYIDKLKLEA